MQKERYCADCLALDENGFWCWLTDEIKDKQSPACRNILLPCGAVDWTGSDLKALLEAGLAKAEPLIEIEF